VQRTLDRLRWMMAGGTLLTLGLGFVLIVRAVRSSLEPIDRLSHEVRERAGHQLDQALDVPGEMPVELVDLAREFDALLARVAVIRRRERDFIRHAAHELRTPIAGLQATTDLALSQPREASAYVRALEDCQRVAGQLGELVKRLSALARIGRAIDPLALAPIDLSAVTGESAAAFRERAAQRGLTWRFDWPEGGLKARSDAATLRIILNNLFDNAVEYAAANGEIRIVGRAADGRVRLEVSNPVDDPPDDPERLFEPLFRRDESRHDAADHLGIGLTLSREAALALGGGLNARLTAERNGLVFVLELPATG
jgi:signal transduction histidine kinase